MPVLLIGTFDTKGAEFDFLRTILHASDIATLAIDAGVINPPTVPVDLPREKFYRSTDADLTKLAANGNRGEAIHRACQAATKTVRQLYREGKVQGILSLGGSAGTAIGTAAMRALPYGVPKLMVSTLASGQVSHFVDVSDILMMHSVVDFCGLNRFSRQILRNAANAMIGMVRGVQNSLAETSDRPLLSATMFGVTTPCIEQSRKILESNGLELLVFHATGTGGRTMEAMIRDGLISGVLDITTTELADELVGGILSAGKDRLTAAAIGGVPQVISVGALDMVNFGPPNTVPERFRERKFYQHNPHVTLMRTTPEENDLLGKEIAQKASASNSPTAILLPLRGVSAMDREGQPFWWPEADQALFQSIRNWISPSVELVELDCHINDSQFAEVATTTMQKLLKR
jgi:uncharacterized protein (UPF0261 family)